LSGLFVLPTVKPAAASLLRHLTHLQGGGHFTTPCLTPQRN